ncbi:MAG TPA: peptidoglycan-binding protein [Bacillales bacterium]|nr:peptidoglycan-binding protein [Bacillales bacterium]
MKKLVSALFVAIAVMLIVPAVSHAAFGDRLMYEGTSGKDVKMLQNLLQSNRYFHYPKSTGYYGPITEQAVKNFQRDHGLKVDGIAGPHTLHALKWLVRGMNGASVKNLQEQLKELGYYHYTVTGYFGSITKAAVERFQSATGLLVDGIAGPHTLDALHSRAGNPVNDGNDDSVSMSVESTAYTADCPGCSGMTTTGVDLNKYPDAKVAAVDPMVIPLGSTVKVPGYGAARAVDTGSAINGKEIDLYFDDRTDALQWGRHNETVTVVK